MPKAKKLNAIDEKINISHAQKYDEFVNRRFFGSLDGLRAISVIAVIWHHTRGPLASALPVIDAGHHGVTLFFAISGFLITTLLLRERQRTGSINLKAFYIRRGLRIFPLYYGVIALYVVLVFSLERNSQVGREFFNNLPFFLTYTSNWFVPLEGRVIFYFAWSLAAEEQFYLVWPGIQKLMRPPYAIVLVASAVVLVAIAPWIASNYLSTEKSFVLKVITSVPLAICIGVLLAHALHFKKSFHVLNSIFGSRFSSSVWMLLFLAVLNWPAAPMIIVHTFAVLLVGACTYREDHILADVLKSRALAYVGTVSYGVYLLHMLVKNAVMKAASGFGFEVAPIGIFLTVTILSVIAAGLSFRYFESFFLDLKSKIGST